MELGWRLGTGVGDGAVSGSAESSDAPWSCGPKTLLVSCPRLVGARAQAAPPPRTYLCWSCRKPLVGRLPQRQKLPLLAPRRPSSPSQEEKAQWRARWWGSFVRTHALWALGSWKGSGRTKQDKAGWTPGTLLGKRRPLIPPRVWVGQGSMTRFWTE